MEHLGLIQKYLEKLSIDPQATELYIMLTKLGPTSALQLAKETRISRTQVYRHLEALEATSLVSAEQLNYGTLFRALPLENIEAIVANREAEMAAIKQNLNSMSQVLQQVAGTAGPKATVLHYYGIGGLKQVNWNLTKADNRYRVFEAAHLSQHLDKAFTRRCRERCIERNLESYDLTNDTAVKAADIEPYKSELAHFRHIDPAILTLNFEVYIYNEVVTLLDYSPEKQLAIEIHHASLNSMMEQMFEAMWGIGSPLTVSG